jgi:hypothetical protein
MKQGHFNENHILGTLFFAVIALAWPTYTSLANAEESPEKKSVSVNSDQQTIDERQPASIPKARVAPQKVKTFAELNLGCGGQQKSVVAESNMIQFKGKACDKGIDFEKVEIVNTKNGYSATVFVTANSQFQTDFVRLEQGENTVKVLIKKRNNAMIEEQFVVYNE